jgi:DNA-binding transcriptional LysR family regulator
MACLAGPNREYAGLAVASACVRARCFQTLWHDKCIVAPIGDDLDMPLISLDIRMLRSFVSVVQSGSITVTARQLGRTQPAITLQLQRLEELTNKTLFRYEGRRQLLTDDGDLVLSYARSILRLHDEMLQRLASPDVEGNVILGTPDLYAAFVLPAILNRFRKAFPKVQVELRCELSTPLVGLVRRGEIDLALVTKMEGFSGGKVVGQEQLIWMVGNNGDAHRADPVPLALLPPGNIYREHAIEKLESIGRNWKIACVSASAVGLQAAAMAGMAVTVLGRSALQPGLREISASEGLPPLPSVDLLLYRAAGRNLAAIDALYNYLESYLGSDSGRVEFAAETERVSQRLLLAGAAE